MPILIDGYNLLHVTGIFGSGSGPGHFQRSRQALLNFLAATIEPKLLPQTTIIFDANEAPPRLPDTLDHSGITVHYARNYPDADTMLEELIEQHHAPKQLIVVSSDHRVQRAARRRRAKPIDSEIWYAELLTARKQRSTTKLIEPTKPIEELNPNEVSYWLEQFTSASDELTPQASAGEDIDDPFPPGYADDLLDKPE